MLSWKLGLLLLEPFDEPLVGRHKICILPDARDVLQLALKVACF